MKGMAFLRQDVEGTCPEVKGVEAIFQEVVILDAGFKSL